MTNNIDDVLKDDEELTASEKFDQYFNPQTPLERPEVVFTEEQAEFNKSLENLSDDPDADRTIVTQDKVIDEEGDELLTEAEIITARKNIEAGEQNIQAGAEAVARGITIGLSDKLLTSLGMDAEDIKRRQEMNPVISTIGEIGGIIGTAPLSLSPAGLITRAAATTTKLTAKSLAQILAKTSSPKIAQEIIKKTVSLGVGGAVEGALYTTGQLVSEEALGKADMTAEHILASYGVGALTGGTLSAGLGGLTFIVPPIKKGISSASGKAKEVVVDKFMDKYESAKSLLKFSDDKWSKIDNIDKDNIVEFLQKNLDSSDILKSQSKFYDKVKNIQEKAGKEIGAIKQELRNLTKGSYVDVNGQQVFKKADVMLQSNKQQYDSLLNDLDTFIENELKHNGKLKPSVANEQFDKIKRYRKDILGIRNKTGEVDIDDIMYLQDEFGKIVNWNKKGGDIPYSDDFARIVYGWSRRSIDDIAESVSSVNQNLAQRLKDANKTYSITKKIEGPLSKTNDSFKLDLKNIVLATSTFAYDAGVSAAYVIGSAAQKQTLFAQKINLMTNVEKQKIKNNRFINESLKNFFNKTGKVVKYSANRGLLPLSSSLAYDPETGRKPKTELEAVQNFKKFADKYNEDPENVVNKMVANPLTLSGEMPKTSEFLIQKSNKMINYLVSELPQNTIKQRGIFQAASNEYKPSTREVKKFLNKLNLVSNPMNIMEKLQNKTITKEDVRVIQANYPQLYTELQSKMMDYIKDNPKLSYRDRLQVGNLFSIPSDPSSVPQSVAKLQSNFEVQEERQQPLASASGRKSEMASRRQSESERITDSE